MKQNLETDNKDGVLTELMLRIKQSDKDSLQKYIGSTDRSEFFIPDNNGRTVLFYAAERGDEEIVWMILSSLAGTGMANQRQALLEMKDNNGHLAEDWAKLKGQYSISDILAVERQRISFFE